MQVKGKNCPKNLNRKMSIGLSLNNMIIIPYTSSTSAGTRSTHHICLKLLWPIKCPDFTLWVIDRITGNYTAHFLDARFQSKLPSKIRQFTETFSLKSIMTINSDGGIWNFHIPSIDRLSAVQKLAVHSTPVDLLVYTAAYFWNFLIQMVDARNKGIYIHHE